jgi:AcrR family transcriptional regulator
MEKHSGNYTTAHKLNHNMAKVLPQYKNEAKRRIVLAALEVMAESGSEKLTMDDVAKKISATKGAVYWYFQNKNALIQEVLEVIDAEFEKNAGDPFFDQTGVVKIPPALNRLVFSDELKKEILIEFGLLEDSFADIPVPNPEFARTLISSLKTEIENKQREGQLTILSDNTTFALILTVLLTGMIRGEIYIILFLGRTRIQQMWFIALKKLLMT